MTKRHFTNLDTDQLYDISLPSQKATIPTSRQRPVSGDDETVFKNATLSLITDPNPNLNPNNS